MYCVKCGVRLADSEKKCPLCGTAVYHPDLPVPHGEPTFPNLGPEEFHPTPHGVQAIFTFVFALAAVLCLVIDLALRRRVTWSGYAAGGIVLAYLTMILPFWFRRPNPIIFTAVDFAALGCYLLYIDLAGSSPLLSRWWASLGCWWKPSSPFATAYAGGTCMSGAGLLSRWAAA